MNGVDEREMGAKEVQNVWDGVTRGTKYARRSALPNKADTRPVIKFRRIHTAGPGCRIRAERKHVWQGGGQVGTARGNGSPEEGNSISTLAAPIRM